MVDLNNDGRVDVLTSVIKRGASRGHVISYQLPNDFVFGQWKRTVLAGGFDQEGSPGRAEAFWPDPKLRGKQRPHIFVNGAGDGGSYILVPSNPETGLGFKKMAATPSYGRVGLTYIGDLSGDGKPELIIPQEDKIHVYTYGIKAKGGSNFQGYDPMETVENPKIAMVPETRFKSNKPTPKTPVGRGGMMNQGGMMHPQAAMGGFMSGFPNPYGPMFNPALGQMYQMMGNPMMAPNAPHAQNFGAQMGGNEAGGNAQLMNMPDVLLKMTNSTEPKSPQIEVFDLVQRSASPPEGAPADKDSKPKDVVPGENTVVEEFEEFSHPMFELTTGAYDNQVLIKNECQAMFSPI